MLLFPKGAMCQHLLLLRTQWLICYLWVLEKGPNQGNSGSELLGKKDRSFQGLGQDQADFQPIVLLLTAFSQSWPRPQEGSMWFCCQRGLSSITQVGRPGKGTFPAIMHGWLPFKSKWNAEDNRGPDSLHKWVRGTIFSPFASKIALRTH